MKMISPKVGMNTAVQVFLDKIVLVDFFKDANQFLIKVEKNSKTLQTEWEADTLSEEVLQNIQLHVKDATQANTTTWQPSLPNASRPSSKPTTAATRATTLPGGTSTTS